VEILQNRVLEMDSVDTAALLKQMRAGQDARVIPILAAAQATPCSVLTIRRAAPMAALEYAAIRKQLPQTCHALQDVS